MPRTRLQEPDSASAGLPATITPNALRSSQVYLPPLTPTLLNKLGLAGARRSAGISLQVIAAPRVIDDKRHNLGGAFLVGWVSISHSVVTSVLSPMIDLTSSKFYSWPHRCAHGLSSYTAQLRSQGVVRRSDSTITKLDIGACTSPRRHHRSQSGSAGSFAGLQAAVLAHQDSDISGNRGGGIEPLSPVPRSPGPTVVMSDGGRRSRVKSSDRSQPGGYLIPCCSSNGGASSPGPSAAARGRGSSVDRARVSPCEVSAAPLAVGAV